MENEEIKETHCSGVSPLNGGLDWQPIETAPKDGTKILTINDDNEMSVSFYVIEWRETSVFVRNAKDGDVYKTVKEDVGYWNINEAYCPTHWMLLPEPITQSNAPVSGDIKQTDGKRVALTDGLGGWIDVETTQPPLIRGQDYSANVWGWDGAHILVVSFFIDSDGWHWANAYGDVWGDAEFDDDYDIKCWQPIAIPLPPNAKLTSPHDGL